MRRAIDWAEISAAAGVSQSVVESAVSTAKSGGPPSGWVAAAVCRGKPLSHFYPSRGEPSVGSRLYCPRCPVASICLASALVEGDKAGTWGGVTGSGLRKLRRALRHSGVLGVVGEGRHIVWREEGADREPAPLSAPPVRHIRPWAEQQQAVAAITAEIREGGVAQVAMATGTGKTLVCLWAAQRMGCSEVAVLVPTLGLASQTARFWRAHWTSPLEIVAVCSDVPGVLATTDPGELRRLRETARLEGRDLLVISTYNSASILSEEEPFDLVIADEAHHLAGAADKSHAGVMRGEVPGCRFLFATATPRTLVRSPRGIEVRGMDAPEFGRRVFELSLREAIERRLVADYRVVVAGVEGNIFRMVSSKLGKGVDPHLLAGAIAVVRTMERQKMRSCLSFHTTIERSVVFATLVGEVAEILCPNERPEGPGLSAWVDGATSVAVRDRILRRLAEPVGWSVVANARALGEGIDVPSLDGIAIVDPRNSAVDVSQAVGRALRLPGGGSKTAVVVLPALLGDDGETIDPRSLQIVSGALRALRSHDGDLGRRLDVARREMSKNEASAVRGARARRRAAQAFLNSHIDFNLPGGAIGELAQSMAIEVVRETTAIWDDRFGHLLAWVEAYGSADVRQGTRAGSGADSFDLGVWCSSQRQLRNRGLLTSDRVAALEGVPGWSWTPKEDSWWGKFEVLRRWCEMENSSTPPQECVFDGVPIGSFVNTVRMTKKTGRLSRDRIAALEGIAAWTWDARGDWWSEHFTQLERFVADNGHACPSYGDLVDGFDIGRWVSKQRGLARSGRLSDDRVALLRSLPGWVDHERDAAWELGYSMLERYVETHGVIPSQKTAMPTGFRVGAWVAKQRAGRARDEERRRRLEGIPGWCWDGRRTWEDAYARLVRYADQHGSALVPDGTTFEGMTLGAWVVSQRTGRRAGRLSKGREELLEAIPGWSWDPYGESFDRGYEALRRFVEREGHCLVPRGWQEGDVHLAGWVAARRSERRRGKLATERAELLGSLPGWCWDVLADPFWGNLEVLKAYGAEHGHASPPQKEVYRGVAIGRWVNRQRQKLRAGELPDAKAQALQGLPGWADVAVRKAG